MSQKEIKSKIVKHGDDLAILLPKAITDGTPVQEGLEITLRRVTQNKFEGVIEDLVKDHMTCQICGQGSGKYTCSICGIVACSNCFWELGNLCKSCTSKQRKK